MKLLLALFLTIPLAVLAKDVKCPKDFIHVKRTPTARNNHTKDWCLGAFVADNMGNRDRARSFCISKSAMLGVPENKAEYDLIIDHITKNNVTDSQALFAVDGQMSQRCKAQIFTLMQQRIKYDTKTMKGDCNIKKNLFVFDDANTDPKYVLSQFSFSIPNGLSEQQKRDGPIYRTTDECIQMQISIFPHPFNTSGCGGKQPTTEKDSFEKRSIDAVVCGRAPL